MPANPTDLQKEDARRLKAIFEEKKRELRLTQAKIGEDYFGAESAQSLVGQYLNGRIPLNLEAAVKFARALRCAVSDFSQTLQTEIDVIAAYASSAVVHRPTDEHIAAVVELMTKLTPELRARLRGRIEGWAEFNGYATPTPESADDPELQRLLKAYIHNAGNNTPAALAVLLRAQLEKQAATRQPVPDAKKKQRTG